MADKPTKRSPAQRRADARYEKKRERPGLVGVLIRVTPEERELLRQAAEEHGSLSSAVVAGVKALQSK